MCDLILAEEAAIKSARLDKKVGNADRVESGHKGATGVVTDLSVALFDSEGRALGTNDNWVSSIAAISSAASVIAST